MKKIGIITLSASNNCGSLLQTYALQKVLINRYGFAVEIIDFRCDASERLYSVFPKSPLKDKRRFINTIFNYKMIKNESDAYESYRDNNLKLTERKYNNAGELQTLDGYYDYIIVGSDQVWNVKMSDYDEAFFLGWVKKSKKVSYAASLGGEKIKGDKNEGKIAEWVDELNAVSVREHVGLDAINEIVARKDVEMVLDPTLLVEASDWQGVVQERLVSEKYIFYYSWAYSNDNINRIVESISKKLNLPVYVINISKWKRYKPRNYGFIMSEYMGPNAFLNLMKYAEYALVQSYHGVIFAYQMQKTFWLLDEHLEEEMDSRLKQIMELLSVNDRVIRRIEDVEDIDGEELNYQPLGKSLNEYRDKSFDFLDRNLV